MQYIDISRCPVCHVVPYVTLSRMWRRCPVCDAVWFSSEMNKKKKDLLEVYVVHTSVMADLLLASPNLADLDLSADLVSLELLQKAWREMLRFTDSSDKSVRLLVNTQSYLSTLATYLCTFNNILVVVNFQSGAVQLCESPPCNIYILP